MNPTSIVARAIIEWVDDLRLGWVDIEHLAKTIEDGAKLSGGYTALFLGDVTRLLQQVAAERKEAE
jgi:hypothetical protein